MSAYAFRTITIDSDVPVRESIASGAVTPGQLIEQKAATTYRRHANSGQDAATIFATEDDLQGKEIGDNYSSVSKVFFKNFRRGDKVWALLADGQSALVNSLLESNGDGDLKVHTPPAFDSDGTLTAGGVSLYTRAVVARALEAVDLSGSSGADPSTRRILVEIM